MHVAIRLPAWVVVACLGVTAGCKEEGRTPPAGAAPPGAASGEGTPATAQAGPGTKPAAASAPATDPALDVPALLRTGGANWSSIPAGEPAGAGVPAAGGDYWIWPADDAVLAPDGDGPNATLPVRLHWRRRPGGQPAGDALYATVTTATRPGAAPYSLRNVAAEFDGRAEGGVVEVRFAPWKPVAAGDVTLFASKPGSSSPASNVLRLKVSPPLAAGKDGKSPPRR